ncbi:hypothetical protein FRB94_008522 [Tulasnella sp. JGI-2019a]|nr:hypothetical protein FRB94_008522 [Tulasnella sp. JGI-2019a]KAG8999375.1 hypothetical protein FRB93_013254 [Tulasnella sp. JGI-2019a]KAG9027184.1 hypothetical protein FRB95_008020 [Tulasnella sp. JGI-2019a]
MRFSTIFVAAATAATFVSAASTTLSRRQGFPNCSLTCLTNASAYGNCSPTDDVCLCNSANYIKTTLDCFMTNCGASDVATANAQSASLCKAAGITVTSAPGEIIIIGSSTQTIPTGSASGTAAAATTTGATGATTTGAAATASAAASAASASATTSKSSANTLTVGSAPILAVAAAALAAFAL